MRKLLIIIIAVLLVACWPLQSPFKSEMDTGPQNKATEDLPSLITIKEFPAELKTDAEEKTAADEKPAETVVIALSDEKVRVPDDGHETFSDKEPDKAPAETAPIPKADVQANEIIPEETEDQGNNESADDYYRQEPVKADPVIPSSSEDGIPVEKAKEEPKDTELDEHSKDIASLNQSESQNEADDATETNSTEDQSVPSPHIHSFSLTNLNEPGCTEAGLKVYTCSCGESYEEPIDALGHDWQLASEYKVTDRESYCVLTFWKVICTSPYCFENEDTECGRPLTVFSADDYGYSASAMFAAYNEHEMSHLLRGEQASYTIEPVIATASADMYDYLLAEMGRTPKAVTELKLMPAATHLEQSFRCTRCGAEK